MRTPQRLLLLAGWMGAGLLGASTAWGCGVCVDDKVASAYDHALVQHALKQGKAVVFCELTGPHEPQALLTAARRVLRKMRGVEQDSFRGSTATRTIAFALDPAVLKPAAALQALDKKLKAGGVVPSLLKVMR